MTEHQGYYRQETTGIRYRIGDLYGYPDSLIRGRTGAAYSYGLPLITNNPRSVLDFGSGRGHGVQAIQDILHPEIIVSAERYLPYLQAQQKGLAHDTQASSFHFVNVNNGNPFKDSSFDAVTLMHVIEHIADPAALLTDIHRILGDNGMLLLATPDIRNLVGKSPYDEHVFGSKELENLLETSGFDTNIYYIVPNDTARRVHERKKWFGTHAPFTQHMRNRVNPRVWDAAVFRSGISAKQLTIDDFTLEDEYDPNTIDLVAVATKV